MTEEKFKELLQENNKHTDEKIREFLQENHKILMEKMDKKFEENNKVLMEKMDKKFEENNKVLMEKMDKKFEENNKILMKEMDRRIEKLDRSINGKLAVLENEYGQKISVIFDKIQLMDERLSVQDGQNQRFNKKFNNHDEILYSQDLRITELESKVSSI